jgi:RNA polymerase sigma factor (sigma-70 family)
MLVRFIEKDKKYKPHSSISPKNWINVIVKSIYNELMRKSKLQRKYFSKTSLNEPIRNNNHNDDNSNSETADFIEDGRPSFFDELCEKELNRKLREAVETLPDDLKNICRLLRNKNVTEIAKELKLSRWSVYDKLHRIEKVFRERGIDKIKF